MSARHRALLLLSAVAMINVYAFGRFNPVQPAGPIFEVPETDVVHNLREKAAASPGELLVDTQTLGATLNGLGLRSVAHILMAPQAALFRTYFPAMDEGRFNQIFNRYGHLQVANIPVPHVVKPDVVEVPIEPFRAVRNVRKLLLDTKGAGVCAQTSGGGIDRLQSNGDSLAIYGWAPWKGESDGQGIRVLSSRPLATGVLTTQKRPDLAEAFQNYDFVKSGFELRIRSRDGKPLQPNELTLLAIGTAEGDIRLACCACP